VQYGCGTADETIEHVLPLCPKWNVERLLLCEPVGDRYNDVPFVLGGYETRKDGQSDSLLDGHRGKRLPDIELVKGDYRISKEDKPTRVFDSLEEREDFKERLECITTTTGALGGGYLAQKHFITP
jgi:hypothetical protein